MGVKLVTRIKDTFIGATVNVKERLVGMINDFRRERRRSPDAICISLADEAELSKLTHADIGDLVGILVKEGPQKAFPEINGVETRWGCNETVLISE
jgi:hypothetical protein